MASADLKKLVTAFLVLSIFSGSLALAFSEFSYRGSPIKPNQSLFLGDSAVPGNAFHESLSGQRIVAPQMSTASAPNNLTDRLAELLAEQIVADNPNGPAREADGALTAQVPENLDRVVDRFVEDPMIITQEYGYTPQLQPIVLASEATPESILRYVTSTQPILDRILSSPIISAAQQKKEPTLEAILVIDSLFRNAYAELAPIPVPSPLVELHQTLLSFIAQGDGLFTEFPTDPLRDAATFDARYAAFSKTASELQRIADEALVKIKNVSLREEERSSFLGFILGVQTVHALVWPVADVTNAPAHNLNMIKNVAKLVQLIFEWLKKLILQFFKDYLIKKIVHQTIIWIQGGGKPQFVTNWTQFLADAANQAIGNKLYALEPKLCQSFGPLIKIAVLPVDNYGRNTAVQCTLTQVLSNVEEFAESFSKGGWIAYGAAMRPSNNLFGSIVQVNDILVDAAASASKAAKSDAKTAKGYKSTQVCVREEEKPDGTKICLEYQNVTPGAVIAKAVDQAFGAPVHRIVNAKDITALISALINSALSKIVQLGGSGLGKGLRGVIVPIPADPGGGPKYVPPNIPKTPNDPPSPPPDEPPPFPPDPPPPP